MISDFRSAFYTHYVSRYKKGNLPQIALSIPRYLVARFEYRFLPILREVGVEAQILEIGCGPGYMLELLSQSGFTRVKGIDVSREQVELAVGRGCDAEAADVFQYLEHRRGEFDAIIGLDFIEHFDKEELMVLARRVFDCLRNRGKLILQTPNGEGLFAGSVMYGDLTHLTIFTRESLRQLLEEVGFVNLSFYETGPTPKDTLGRLRSLLWTLTKCLANVVCKIQTGKSRTIWTDNLICSCEKPVVSQLGAC